MYRLVYSLYIKASKDIARKRISFDLVYLIAEYILDNLDTLVI